ncbi:hypothetical protein [Polluticoccus soli]|uniref:hypothetical protein n=1 Tax=Polluticoccus soli TaxID=3034150 RepID=UPI0023E267E1|nr:hypothetical protein [Flavipsychrobacter sp. JY13-12]
MRALFACFLLLAATNLNAQEETKGFLSATNYTAGNASQLADVKIRKGKLPNVPGEFIFHISSANFKLNKQVQSCWALERNDSLFVNCNKIFRTSETNKGLPSSRKITFERDIYSYILFRSANYLHFRAGRTNTFGIPSPYVDNQNYAGVVDAVLASGANGAMAASDDQVLFHYLYDLHTGKITYFNRGVMRNYLKNPSYPEDTAFTRYVGKLIAAEK